MKHDPGFLFVRVALVALLFVGVGCLQVGTCYGETGTLVWKQPGLYNDLKPAYSRFPLYWQPPAPGWPRTDPESTEPSNWTSIYYAAGGAGIAWDPSGWARVATQQSENTSLEPIRNVVRVMLSSVAPNASADDVANAVAANETLRTWHGDSFKAPPIFYHVFDYSATWNLTLEPDTLAKQMEQGGTEWASDGGSPQHAELVNETWRLTISGSHVQSQYGAPDRQFFQGSSFDIFQFKTTATTQSEAERNLKQWLAPLGVTFAPSESRFERDAMPCN